MRKILKLTFLAALIMSAVSCKKEKAASVAWLDVTANNIAGVWELAEWNGGESPAEGTYVYIEFTRRNRLFTLYQNTDSFSPRKITGRFSISEDEEYGAVIRGVYDYGNGDWNHRYIIRNLTSESMTWIALDNAEDISVYKRRDSVPAEILEQFPADED